MNNKKTIDLEHTLKHASEHNLNEYISELDELTFSAYVDELILAKELSKSDVIRDTHLDRTYAYQILQGSKKGGKYKIIQFALALKCTLEECDRLLKLSNNGILYAKVKRDAIIIYALEHKLDVFKTNDLLIEHQQEILQ